MVLAVGRRSWASTWAAGRSSSTSVDTEKTSPAVGRNMDKLIAAISERVNPGGQKEITVRPLGADKIQITMPAGRPARIEKERQAEAAQIKRIISHTGSMEFRIVANTQTITLADRTGRWPSPKRQRSEGLRRRRSLAKWVPVNATEDGCIIGDRQFATRQARRRAEALVGRWTPTTSQGNYLKQATAGVDQTGRPCVNFSFNTEGARLFERLTGDNLPEERFKRQPGHHPRRRAASAPTINSAIFDRGRDHRRLHPQRSRRAGPHAQRRQPAGAADQRSRSAT